MNKKIFFQRALHAMVFAAVLIVLNVPQVLGAFVLTGGNINSTTLQYGYGYNTVSGLYGYGYGYGMNYWLANGSPENGVLAGSQLGDPSSGTVTISGTVQAPGVAGSGQVSLDGSQPLQGGLNAILDMSTVATLVGGLQQVTLNGQGNPIVMESTINGTQVSIPDGTVLTAETALGSLEFRLPQVETVNIADPTSSDGVGSIGVGITIGHVNLSQAATIQIPFTALGAGVTAGDLDVIFLKRDNDTTWSEQDDGVCTGAGNTLGTGQDVCHYFIDSDSNGTLDTLVIKTLKLSQFGAFNVTSGTTTTTGGGGGGGGGPSGPSVVPTVTTITQTSVATVVTLPSGTQITVPAGTTVKKTRFPDVPANSWYYNFVETLRKLGVVQGTIAGKFEPWRELTRAELTKIALNLFLIEIPTSLSVNPFDDVNKNEWYAPYIQRAKELGIVSGYATGDFRPNAPINRVEALKILLTASGLDISGGNMNFPDTLNGTWYEQYVAFAKANGVVSGYPDGTFGPANNILRSEMAKIAVQTLELIQ